MGLNSNSSEKTQRPIPPAGIQLAVCYSIINLGSQEEHFPGKPPVTVNKVHFSWELPQLPMVTFDEKKGQQPMALFHEYSVSVGERAKLPQMLKSWGNMPAINAISAPLLKAFLGQACMVNIVHTQSKNHKDSKTGQPLIFANIGQNGLAVMPRMANIPKPTGTINPVTFLDLDAFDWTIYNSLPTYIQDKIAKSKEWSGILAKNPKPASMNVPTAHQNSAIQPNQQFVQQQQQQTFEATNPVVFAQNSDIPEF